MKLLKRLNMMSWLKTLMLLILVNDDDTIDAIDYNAKIKDIKDKILDITKLATNDALNAKINGVKGEIPSISDLASTSAYTAVKGKIEKNEKKQKWKKIFYFF